GRRPGFEEMAERVVGVDLALDATRRPERDERARVELQLTRRAPEEFVVLRVRARPARLDEVDAEPVELFGDAQLVVDGQRDALELRAVAQRRVVDLDASGKRGFRHVRASRGTARPARARWRGTSPAACA